MFKLVTFFLLVFLNTYFHMDVCRGQAKEERPLQAEAKLNSYEVEPGQTLELKIDLQLLPGYHAYEEQFKIQVSEPEGFRIARSAITPLQEFHDPVSKKQKRGVADRATLSAVMEAPSSLPKGDSTLKIVLTYQACTETYCLFPTSLPLEVHFHTKSPASAIKENLSFLHMKFEDVFAKGLHWAFLFVFIAGFLTSFTPCVFPMIPITLAILGRHAHLRSRRHNFLLAHLYVLGIAATYATLGVFAAATGAMFGSFMSHPLVLSIICLVFLAMALSLFGLYDLEAPAFIRKRFSGDLHLHGLGSAFVYGVIAGAIASPCVGPVLVGILTYVAKTQNLWLGFWLLFVFAIGMGQLFLFVGLSSQATKFLPKSGPWMDGVKTFFGFLMMGAFYYYLNLLLPQRWFDGVLGLGLICAGSLFGAFSAIKNTHHRFYVWIHLRKGLAWAALVIGGIYMALAILNLRAQLLQQWIEEKPGFSVDANNWQVYSEQALGKAKADGKPVMIDFSAEWCAACKELEQFTFTNQRFQLFATQFVLLRFDATKDSAELSALKKKYEIVGLPTVIFFDAKGNWIKEATVNEFLQAPEFIKHMEQALRQ